MRVSGDPTSIHYWRRAHRTCPEVRLDGAVVEHVVEADSDHGWLRREIWADGKAVIAAMVLPDGRVLDHVIAMETLRGGVQITVDGGAA